MESTVLVRGAGTLDAAAIHWAGMAAISLDFSAYPRGGDLCSGDLKGCFSTLSGRWGMESRTAVGVLFGVDGASIFLQHLFDYIHAPVILLGMLVVATPVYRSFSERWCRGMVLGFAVFAVLASPLASPQRAKAWWTCFDKHSNAELHQQLAVLENPNWSDLARVVEFLRQQQVKNREVCCYHSDLVSLYNRMDLVPPTRYVYVQELTVFFPDRRRRIIAEIQQSPHRFIVTDTVSARLTSSQLEKLFSSEYQSSLTRPTINSRPYPWGYPIVFRSGSYLVHQVPAY